MTQVLEQPQTVTSQTPETVQAKPNEESLITRASRIQAAPQASPQPDSNQDSIKLDQQIIDKITDPQLKQAVIEARNSMQADYTRKTQDLAARRKEMDTLKAQLESTGQYTPAKIQELLSNPSFVQAAQEYQRQVGPQATNANSNGQLTQEELSYLSPEQQKAYQASIQAQASANQALQAVSSVQNKMAAEREDMSLKNKYVNYEGAKVDEIYNGMMSGSIQATREHLWKVLDYEPAVQRAYQLGLQDRKLEQSDKLNASSQPNSISVTSADDIPTRLPNENSIEYFKRLAANRMKNLVRK